VSAVEPLRARIASPTTAVGFNHIEHDQREGARARVTNTPDVLTDDTADDAMMLILMVARRGGKGPPPCARRVDGVKPTHILAPG